MPCLSQCNHCFPVWIYRKFCCRRRCRCSQISSIVGNSGICLMSYGTYYRFFASCNNSRKFLVIKCPQIFNRTAATPYYYRIDISFFKILYPFYYSLCCPCPLNFCRIQYNLYIRIPSIWNIAYILYDSSCSCGNYTYLCRICRNFSFFRLIKKPLL